MKLQTSEIKGAPSAIVPIRDYEQLRDALEDAAGREALRQKLRQRRGDRAGRPLRTVSPTAATRSGSGASTAG